MPTAAITERVFEDRPTLVAALRDHVAKGLRDAVANQGRARLGVSGGSTPRPLYEALRDAEVDWSRVTVVLVDERWVEADHPASNEAMVRAALLHGAAASARFVALKSPGDTPEAGLAATAAEVFSALGGPLDVAVLGMGADGHTLSWFPGAANLAAALDPGPGGLVTWVRALPSAVTGDYVERITLTCGAVKPARLALMITGAEKREAFDAALADGPVEAMPIRALLRDPDVTLDVFWAP